MVNINILDNNFQLVGVVDSYESFIWTDRFGSYGDFEIYTAFDYDLIELCQQDYYIRIDQSEHLMIIEGIEIESDSDNGNKLRITGRSLESILNRRIVWQQTIIDANTTLQNAIKYLIQDSFLDPQPYSGTRVSKRRNATQTEISNKRKLTNLIFEDTDDSYILGLKVEKFELTGDNIYDVILTLLEDMNNTVGFKILLNEQNQFVFKLYSGLDRSYEQQEYVKTEDLTRNPDKTYYILQNNQYVVYIGDLQKGVTYYEYRGLRPYVVFSPQFDNVINSNYIDNTSEMKNVTLVAGEGEGSSRKTIIVGDSSDLPRRELFTDARDMQSSEYGSGTKYTEALKVRGTNKLIENSRVTSYEGKVEATRQYVYGEDFFMGDIIQMANEYGIEGNARVIEWVLSDDVNGFETYPTFDAVQVIDTTVTEEDNS